eukprot:TRINITY_DN2075_c0_g1_i4.p1 TRINITY_DN2075_c0_g1~~TRINITY_DN2075_c0_g1_i4.p1  ORF type:complete len:197 (+),score=24.22 TRINITY_DN2075_c0_g1_i4:39-629(+)
MAQQILKIVTLGQGGSGKSSLVVRFTQGVFTDDWDPTLDDNYRKIMEVDNQTLYLEFIDSAGREEYSAMRDQYMRNGNGFMICFSITDTRSFDEVDDWYNQVLRVKDADWFPTIIVGCKADLEEHRAVTEVEVHTYARDRAKTHYVLTSAKQNSNVDDAFHLAAKVTLDHMKAAAQPPSRKKNGKGILQRANCLLQ